MSKITYVDLTRYGIKCIVAVQGGSAKVGPTYIFAGSVWYLNV